MKRAVVWMVSVLGLVLAAPLPQTYQEMMVTPFCKKYQCYNLPTDKQPATDQGVGTYLFLKKSKATLFIRSKDGKLTALGWNLPVASTQATASQTEIRRALSANAGFIQEFSQTFFASLKTFDTARCLQPQTSNPSITLGGKQFELICYYSSGEILFTGQLR